MVIVAHDDLDSEDTFRHTRTFQLSLADAHMPAVHGLASPLLSHQIGGRSVSHIRGCRSYQIVHAGAWYCPPVLSSQSISRRISLCTHAYWYASTRRYRIAAPTYGQPYAHKHVHKYIYMGMLTRMCASVHLCTPLSESFLLSLCV